MRNYAALQKWFFLAGLLLFAYLIYRLNPSVLLQHLRRVGPNFFFILAATGAQYVSYSLAWEIFLKSRKRLISFWEILKIKIAGEAVNAITPLSWGGGDPARVLMLKAHVPVAEGAASVVVDRTLNNLALALFLIGGTIAAFLRFSLPTFLKVGIPLAILAVTAVSVFVYLRSHEGITEFFLDLAERLRIKRNFSEKTRLRAREIDGYISGFYKNHRGGFLAAFLLHLLGRLFGLMEIFLAAWFLGFPLSFMDSYLLAMLTVVVNMIFVFIPGAMGVMEGAFAAVFALFNLDPAVGTSIQILRRARMVFWTSVGFVFMSGMKAKPDQAAL